MLGSIFHGAAMGTDTIHGHTGGHGTMVCAATCCHGQGSICCSGTDGFCNNIPLYPQNSLEDNPEKKNYDTKAEVKLCTADGSWQGDGKDSIIFKEHATGSLAMLWSTWEKQIVLSIFFLIFFFLGGVQE